MELNPRVLIADNISLEFAESLESIEFLAHPENVDVMVYYDAPAGNFESARIQKCLIDFAKRFNLRFLQGHGVGYYALHLNTDEVLVSCGYQNSLVGATGNLGFHVGEVELKKILETGIYAAEEYETYAIQVIAGKYLKNASLSFIKEHFNDLSNKIIEFTGSDLTLQNKRDICQILSQISVCAVYKDSIENVDAVLNLNNESSVIVEPGKITNIEPTDSYIGKKLDACFIGGCTGGSIEDLRLAASIWKGKHIPVKVRVCVAPISNEVFLQAIEEGLLEIFIDCGAQILNAGCASCRTTSKGVLGSNEVMLATSMHNEAGCCGTKDSYVYLANTEIVAKSALEGKIVRG